MESLNWFKIDCLYPINVGLTEQGEIDDVKRIQLANEGIFEDFEKGTAVLNLAEDTIVHLIPKCFIPNGKVRKKYYTEVVLKSGDVVYAEGTPDSVYAKLVDYINNLPPIQQSEHDE
jgi:hypothetical protein